MLQSILNALSAFWNFLVSEITGLVNIVANLFNSITLINTVMGYFPSILAAFVSLSISFLVIKFVIGR